VANIPPQPKVGQIIWFENHIPLWQATPAAFGVTAAQVTAVDPATKAARTAYTAAVNAAMAATQTKDEARAAYVAAIRPLVRRLQASAVGVGRGEVVAGLFTFPRVSRTFPMRSVSEAWIWLRPVF
jgi:hypothetical protein